MIARMGLAIGLLAALPSAAPAAGQLTAEQPAATTPAPRHPPNGPPPRIYAPPTYAPAAPPIYAPVPPPNAAPAPRRFRIPPQTVYPEAALRADIRGRCIIAFTVDADGVPQDIVPDCSDPVFADAARDAVAATRFDMDEGPKPGEVLYLPIRFDIQ